MSGFQEQLRQQALQRKAARKKGQGASGTEAARLEAEIMRGVATFLGVTEEVAANCCGSVCPDCDIFLDKAIALVELGHPPHVFLNPTQEEVFTEALRLFRDDREEYKLRRNELIKRIKRSL